MAKHEGSHTVTKLLRGRANTYDHSPVEISEPRFVFTDAEARDDLYTLPRRASENEHLERPTTAEGYRHVNLLPMAGSGRTAKQKSGALPLLDAAAALRYQTQAQLGIGMALGSPSQSPWKSEGLSVPRSGSTTFTATPQSFSSIPYSPATTPDPREDPNKQKGKWKVLGGLFSKKGNSSPGQGQEPFYKVQPDPRYPQPQTAQLGHRRQHSRSLELPSTRSAASPLPPSSAPGRRQVQMLAGPRPLLHTPEYSPIPPPKDDPKPSPRPGSRTTEAPRLQVDFPDIKMERYSVMFNNVLNPRQSTLLLRRQAQLEKLKVIQTPIIEEPPQDAASPSALTRRATVPSPAKSPSYSLFPQAAHRGASPKPPTSRAGTGQLRRADTAPSPSAAKTQFPKNTLAAPSHKPVTPQILVEDQEISPTNDSPVTPKEASWSEVTRLTPRQARSISFGETLDVNPRDPISDSIVVHLAPEVGQDATVGWKPQVPPPRKGAIELGGTPVYKTRTTSILSPTPKRPGVISPLPGLNKPLPTPSPSPESEETSRPAEADSRQIPRKPSPPKRDKSPPVPAKDVRPTGNRQPNRGSSRPVHNNNKNNNNNNPPQHPPREQSMGLGLSVQQPASQPALQPLQQPAASLQRTTTQAVAPQQLSPLPPTEFHLRSPRKASLPAQSSQPLEPRAPRKTSLAAVEMAARQAGRLLEQSEEWKAAKAGELAGKAGPAQSGSGQSGPAQSRRAGGAHGGKVVSPRGDRAPRHPNAPKSASPVAAEISIARQISISRRQQMMVPIMPKSARGPQQATLVMHGGAQGAGMEKHVARKSQHALLETA